MVLNHLAQTAKATTELFIKYCFTSEIPVSEYGGNSFRYDGLV